MEYSIRELARLAGVTARTLRWYDSIHLLKPSRTAESGCRYYGPAEVNRLQDILFYRALGVELAQIREYLDTPDFDRLTALRGHLTALEAEEQRIQQLILAVQETIDAEERNIQMNDEKKFEAFRQKALTQYEKQYETEARALYGREQADLAKKEIRGMPPEKWQECAELEQKILRLLEAAVTEKRSPDSPEGTEIAGLHRRWLQLYIPNFRPVIQKELAGLYTADPRFTRYYDRNIAGCAAFLRESILHRENF